MTLATYHPKKFDVLINILSEDLYCINDKACVNTTGYYTKQRVIEETQKRIQKRRSLREKYGQKEI